MFPENHIYFYLFGWNYLNERHEAYKYRFGLQKGVENQRYFSDLKNMMFQLSNTLSSMFIYLKLVKLRQIKVLSVAPPKGPQTLPWKFLKKIWSCKVRYEALNGND